MPQIITEAPIYRTVQPEIVDSSPRKSGGRGSLVLFLLIILLVGWMYTTQNFSSIRFGVNRSPSVLGGPGSTPSEAGNNQVGSVGVPAIRDEGTINIPITQNSEPVALPEAPAVTATPAVPAPQYPAPQYPAPQYPAPQYPAPQYPAPQYQDPEITGYARTTADNVNLRRGPGINYRAALVVPMGWQVLVLRQTHVDNSGEVWVEVSVWTEQGYERGWVNQRYLALTQ